MPRSSSWICSSMAGDLGRGVEVQRIGALEIGLGLGELVLGRAFARPCGGFPASISSSASRVRSALVWVLAMNSGGVAQVRQIRIDAVGEAALLAHLVIEPRGERAAAEDVVDHEGRHEVRVLARDAHAAEPHHRLRHVELRPRSAGRPSRRRHVRARGAARRSRAARRTRDRASCRASPRRCRRPRRPSGVARVNTRRA